MFLKRFWRGYTEGHAYGGEVHVKARIYGRIHTDEHEEHTQQRCAYGGEFT